ncbi:protein LURP-one-related 17-like [Olea europaea var. sylvestris]|uniref:protein LURP-one-related 17-like n=1 Tax=Olea europaea var. sylvestris TaxID=158386 RepID=UPI000C1D0451|nr:protein LURP-one-related 17-like [Olea europaea var. sylvestris]
MLLFLKSTSGKVKQYPEEEQDENKKKINETCCCTSLTVWRKSLLFNCKGFTVIGSDGSLLYRVDNYTGHPIQIILMDGSGNPIFTICNRKKLGLVDSWLIYEGEVGEDRSIKTTSKKPIYSVRKNFNIIQTNLNVLAYVYGGISHKRYAYMIEGSYANRSCRILDNSRRIVAEIKKKEAINGGVSYGLEVFILIVRPGFDSRFAMAIVLLLDQMFS